MDIGSLWLDIKAGDEKAFEMLFRDLGSSLYRYAYGIVRDEVIAEEIVHDVFLKIWTNRRTIVLHGTLKSYIYRAVHNNAINRVLQMKTIRMESSQLVSDETWEKIMRTCECGQDIIGLIEAAETGRQIGKIIESLPGQCREIFNLSRSESLPNKEIAEKLGIDQGTVRTQIFRALNKIRDSLRGE